MKGHPFVSIIIVNYNGRHLLDECFSAITKQDYPKDRFEVILVDNNSHDYSVPYVRKYYPWVRLVESDQNLGFAAGNQLGFDHAKGECIVLLNNDVNVAQNWLSELVLAAKPKKVGIVNSKLYYDLPFLELKINSPAIPRSKIYHTIDHSPIGIILEEVVCDTPELSKQAMYRSGFYEKSNGDIVTRRTTGNAEILVPFDLSKKRNSYILNLHGLESREYKDTNVKIFLGEKLVAKSLVQPYAAKELKLTIKKQDAEKNLKWLVQNAGLVIMHDGYGKDRGSGLSICGTERKEFYEEDSDYFSKPVELLAACGASMLIKREVISQIGFLDGHYFMYYEDVDLSMRAWRAGWKIMYAPKSIGFHKHRASTGNNESTFFVTQVEKNHLNLVFTHFPLSTAFSQTIFFLVRLIMSLVKSFVFQFYSDDGRTMHWRIKLAGRKTAFKYLSANFFRLLKNRYALSRLVPFKHQEMKELLY